MVPDYGISVCPEHEVKSKIGTISVNEVFMSIVIKKYKLMRMDVNTYYLELIFILLNIFQQ